MNALMFHNRIDKPHMMTKFNFDNKAYYGKVGGAIVRDAVAMQSFPTQNIAIDRPVPFAYVDICTNLGEQNYNGAAPLYSYIESKETFNHAVRQVRNPPMHTWNFITKTLRLEPEKSTCFDDTNVWKTLFNQDVKVSQKSPAGQLDVQLKPAKFADAAAAAIDANRDKVKEATKQFMCMPHDIKYCPEVIIRMTSDKRGSYDFTTATGSDYALGEVKYHAKHLLGGTWLNHSKWTSAVVTYHACTNDHSNKHPNLDQHGTLKVYGWVDQTTEMKPIGPAVSKYGTNGQANMHLAYQMEGVPIGLAINMGFGNISSRSSVNTTIIGATYSQDEQILSMQCLTSDHGWVNVMQKKISPYGPGSPDSKGGVKKSMFNDRGSGCWERAYGTSTKDMMACGENGKVYAVSSRSSNNGTYLRATVPQALLLNMAMANTEEVSTPVKYSIYLGRGSPAWSNNIHGTAVQVHGIGHIGTPNHKDAKVWSGITVGMWDKMAEVKVHKYGPRGNMIKSTNCPNRDHYLFGMCAYERRKLNQENIIRRADVSFTTMSNIGTKAV